MSADIRWRPASEDGQSVPCDAPSRFAEAMGKEFGRGEPWELDDNALPWLRAAQQFNPGESCYAELAAHIELHGRIQVWRVW